MKSGVKTSGGSLKLEDEARAHGCVPSVTI